MKTMAEPSGFPYNPHTLPTRARGLSPTEFYPPAIELLRWNLELQGGRRDKILIVVQSQKMKKRTKISLGGLSTIIVIVGISITPTIWRYSSYRKARLTIESGDETKSIQLITQLYNNPFFNLDWTIQKSVFKVPHGNRLYESIFGCPSCRGDFNTLLYHAVENGHLSLAHAMISLGASIESHDDGGYWMLVGAIHSKNTEMLNLIISNGANVAQDNGMSFSSIHIATLSGQNEILKVLVENKADINATDFRGWTPLDWACIWNTNAIPHLLEYGAKLGTNRTMELPKGKNLAEQIKKNAHPEH